MTETEHSLVPVESIAQNILLLRGQKVILDADLARLYGVTTKQLNQAVRRNLNRFPSDFVFQVTSDEKAELVTNCDRFTNLKHSSVNPYAFTEHGAVMAASILKTETATAVSVYVVRAFVRMREMLSAYGELSEKLRELDTRLTTRLDATDDTITTLIEAIHRLLAPPETSDRRIGFRQPED